MGLKKHLKLQNLKKNLKNIYKKNKEKLFDIVLFGSVVKGKEFIGDVDIAVIFKDEIDRGILKAVESIREDIHIAYLKLDELYSQGLWVTLIREGYSLSKNKFLKDLMNLKSFGLFTYNLKNVKNKSRFSQVLRGYKSESILKKVGGEVLKPGVVIVPMDNVEYFRTFLQTWKAKYTLKYVLI